MSPAIDESKLRTAISKEESDCFRDLKLERIYFDQRFPNGPPIILVVVTHSLHGVKRITSTRYTSDFYSLVCHVSGQPCLEGKDECICDVKFDQKHITPKKCLDVSADKLLVLKLRWCLKPNIYSMCLQTSTLQTRDYECRNFV